MSTDDPPRAARIAQYLGITFWVSLAAPFAYILLSALFSDSWPVAAAAIKDTRPLKFLLVPFFLAPAWATVVLYAYFSQSPRPPIHWFSLTGRFVFLLLSIFSMLLATNEISRIADHVLQTGFIELPPETKQGDAQLEQTLLHAVTRAAVTQNFDQIIAEALRDDDIAHAEVYFNTAKSRINHIPPKPSVYGASGRHPTKTPDPYQNSSVFGAHRDSPC